MKIEIFRDEFDEDSPERGILGKLYINGVYLCDTLEPPYLSKFGCVEAGSYDLVYHYSPSFRRQMIYLDMASSGSKRSGIMFHAGNSSLDTKGCILVGHRDVRGSFYLVCSKIFLQKLTENFVSRISEDKKLIIYDKFSSK